MAEEVVGLSHHSKSVGFEQNELMSTIGFLAPQLVSSYKKLKCAFTQTMVTYTGSVVGKSKSVEVDLDCVEFVIKAQGSF